MKEYQKKVSQWLIACFGEEIANDKQERCFRFMEESLELVQSLGMTKEQVLQLVDYTFSRPLGEPIQEVGGVIVTLNALCYAVGISLERCADMELDRVNEKIEKIRSKHFSKPKNITSPLPGNDKDEDENRWDDDFMIAMTEQRL